ncbi:MAG: ribosome recycling factor [Coriobacteriaceae bacterium]|jgi:ribosome recycling factor|nr:ribosome recycling factor [Coriobacteriaceae bacterium]
MDYDEILMAAEERMENALDALGTAFASVRTGRANARVLDRIKVDYYGAMTPINQLAGVKTPDARLLVIEPWDKSSLKAIEKAIQESDLGVTPNNDGSVIRLPFPELTEERRRELAKQCKGYAEDARVSIRNARRDANSQLAKAEKAGDITEDDLRGGEADVQKLTDKYIGKVDDAFKTKEAELMAV